MKSLNQTEATTRCDQIIDQVCSALVGKRDVARLVLIGILGGGHVLIDDRPGVGKTLLARSFATALGLRFTRVQFTPDMLPSDLTGVSVYDQRTGDFTFRPGPVFTHLLLADEVNRTPPKTQAALLEAMAERQVSVDGQTRPLPDPFVVLATQNPVEFEGTYPLPEAQLDRFLLRTRIGYLTAEDEADMVRRRVTRRSPAMPGVCQVLDIDAVLELRASLEQVEIDDEVLAYAVQVATRTREHPKVELGASPRATLDLVQASRTAALLDGRGFTLPEDVKALAGPVLAHRIRLRPEVWVQRVATDQVVDDVLDEVPVPRTEEQP